MLEELLSYQGIFSLLVLILLEISLGIDNIIFISIFVSKVEKNIREQVRLIGLSLALGIRIIMLFSITWIISLQHISVQVLEWQLSIKDFILIIGGLFLIAKTTKEIHGKIENKNPINTKPSQLISSKHIHKIVWNIVLIDFIFSFDSILTAVGLTRNLLIMIIAVCISMVIMFFFSRAIGKFLNKHITFQMLALSFLVMIGFVLILEGFGQHISKGYIYFAMLFSFTVEFLNMRVKDKQ